MDRTNVDVTKIDVAKMDLTFWSGQLSYDDYMYFNMRAGLPSRTDDIILENRKRVDAAFWARHLSLEKMIQLQYWYGKTSSEITAHYKFVEGIKELSSRPLNELLTFLKTNSASMDPKINHFIFNWRTGELLKQEQFQINVEPDIFNPQPSIPDILYNKSQEILTSINSSPYW